MRNLKGQSYKLNQNLWKSWGVLLLQCDERQCTAGATNPKLCSLWRSSEPGASVAPWVLDVIWSAPHVSRLWPSIPGSCTWLGASHPGLCVLALLVFQGEVLYNFFLSSKFFLISLGLQPSDPPDWPPQC